MAKIFEIGHSMANLATLHHPTLFAKRTEKQGSLNWFTPYSTLPSSIMNYD